ncbi:ABC transporter permease [Microvirga terrae]|uniref:Transport permease protein n=1 Tax=Microvirga terrae TaxID=2740529 RepID=A0ABY5RN91_9HYPH|nr:ABC transporter permease [Microvirga terrae]UVF18428.1 ABC transporter permease [Microvirga terrae]
MTHNMGPWPGTNSVQQNDVSRGIKEPDGPQPTIIIKPRGRTNLSDLREIVHYRTVIYFLVWRDFKVRYRQTLLGVLWALLQPLASMIVFSVVFHRLAGISSDEVPYPIFVLAGLLPWGFFAHALASASGSLVSNHELLRQIYFPRMIIPLSSIISCVSDFVTSFGLLIVTMVVLGVPVSLNIAFLPLFLLVAFCAALGVGAALAAAHIRYRDVGYVTPFAIQILMFLTPVVYPSSLIPDAWRLVYALNPMAGVIEGVRWSVLGISPHPEMIIVSIVTSFILLLVGTYYFLSSESSFADIV